MRRIYHKLRSSLTSRWRMFWLARSGRDRFGRMAAWLACRHTIPYQQRSYLADLHPHGFIAPGARISHAELVLGKYIYLGDGVVILLAQGGGRIVLDDRVHLYGESFVETGQGGTIEIGESTHIQPGCHLHAYLSGIKIGKQVEIAPNCGFYSYNHGMAAGIPIMEQRLQSKGPIEVGDGAWIGHGAIVLQGVSIGAGAVIAAGAVVLQDVPAHTVAAGAPARVIKRIGESSDMVTPSASTMLPAGKMSAATT